MTTAERAALAWRRTCPDITDQEIAAMLQVGMRGTRCAVVLRAYRAGAAMAADTDACDPLPSAIDVLWRCRHSLAPDVLRTLADIWTCASAARYGEPYERWWEGNDEDAAYSNHDVPKCESEGVSAA